MKKYRIFCIKTMPQNNLFKTHLFLSIFCLLTISQQLLAQKPELDVNSYKSWPVIGPTAGISNNGVYVYYSIDNSPVGSSTLIIYDTKKNTSLEIINGMLPEFTNDSRRILYMVNDSLIIHDLSNQHIQIYTQVSEYSLRHEKKNDWLFVNGNNLSKDLIIVDLKSLTEKRIDRVNSFTYLPVRESLLVNTDQNTNADRQAISLYSLNGELLKKIWSGKKAKFMITDEDESKCAFIEDTGAENAIKCVSINTDTEQNLIEKTSLQIPPNMEIPKSRMNTWKFSHDGNRLFFNLQEKKKFNSSPGIVTIWNYKDTILQSEQDEELDHNPSYLFTYVFNKRNVVQLSRKYQECFPATANVSTNDTYLTVRSKAGHPNEWNWNPNSITKISLVNTITGECQMTTDNSKFSLAGGANEISPTGKYFIYYDAARKNYMAYNIKSGILQNITENIQTKWTTYYTQISSFPETYPVGISGYTPEDKAILINDMYNIWLIDLEGKRTPINLTGQQNQNIIYTVAIPTYPHPKIYSSEQPIILISFNLTNKEYGFHRLTLGKVPYLSKLTEGPFSYGNSNNPYSSCPSNRIIKARDCNMYIVLRENSIESPNYYLTKDFIHFKKISDIHPEKKYNWLSTELHTYRLNDGTFSTGILYKPENFDPHKKYPVILQYYWEVSHLSNTFLTPDLEGSTINVPIMVSKGYLVFKPDMHYQLGKIGDGALVSVLGAYDYLKDKTYIDSSKIALNGHSFGGYETNYIIAHSNKFRAAISASGFCDLIRMYGSTWGSGESQQQLMETGYLLMDGTLWEKKAAYISNSPILDADKITTPLLMMNNKEDISVNFSQGVALFTGLRRLGKKVWMLEYDKSNHVLTDPAKQRDFQVRMEQFLDHYLKDTPIPEWMEYGLPASREGLTDGLKLVYPQGK